VSIPVLLENDRVGVFDVEFCDCAWFPFLFVDAEKSRVIGNIYENKNLIETEKEE